MSQEAEEARRKFYQSRFEKEVQEFQRRNFHERYVGASLCKLEAGSRIASSLQGFIKNPKNILLYHGSPGIGKTYFCAAMVECMMMKFNTLRYHTEENLLSKLRNDINQGSGGDYIHNLKFLIDDDLVILDDVASGINPEKSSYRDLEFRREVFFSFLDYRYNMMKPTIITSNFTREDFKNVYSDRIYSRLFAKENTIISVFGDEAIDRRQN